MGRLPGPWVVAPPQHHRSSAGVPARGQLVRPREGEDPAWHPRPDLVGRGDGLLQAPVHERVGEGSRAVVDPEGGRVVARGAVPDTRLLPTGCGWYGPVVRSDEAGDRTGTGPSPRLVYQGCGPDGTHRH